MGFLAGEATQGELQGELLRGFPRLFTGISEHICFLLLVFFLFLHFLVVGSVR